MSGGRSGLFRCLSVGRSNGRRIALAQGQYEPLSVTGWRAECAQAGEECDGSQDVRLNYCRAGREASRLRDALATNSHAIVEGAVEQL